MKILNKVEHFELIMIRLNVIIEYFSSLGTKEFDQQTIELDKKTNGVLNPLRTFGTHMYHDC